MKILAVAIQIADEGSDAALEIKRHLAVRALIQKVDHHPARDKCHFSEPLNQRIEAEIHFLFEDLWIILERGSGPMFTGCCLPDHFHWSFGVTAFVTLEMNLSIQPHFNFTPLGKRVDRADAHTVQAAGNFVCAAAEFSAGVKCGHYDF